MIRTPKSSRCFYRKRAARVYMPAYEDEHGTYIMNSKDLRACNMLSA